MSSSVANPLTPFLELHRHRALLRTFARRQIEVRHRASFLGLAWMVLVPLISLTIYTFVFGFVFEGRFTADPAVSGETRLDYALGIFLGLVLFNFLAEVLGQSPNTVVSQPNFVKKVVFPLEILPAAVVGAAAFSTGISLFLALFGVLALGHGLTLDGLWVFAIFPPIALLAFGCAWFFSALGVFVRDIATVMPFIVQILVYVSAVFYPVRKIQQLPEFAQWLMLANPLLHAVESLRRAVLWHEPIAPGSLAYLWVSAIVIYIAGYAIFQKARPAFADVL